MYLLLFALWLLLNGKITLEICIFGTAVVGLLATVIYALFGYTPKKELRLYTKLPIFFVYLAALVWEVLKANVSVMKIILHKKRPVSPALVTFRVEFHTEFARYMLANSVTLTPGTITVETDENEFIVHCLSEKMLEGIESGRIIRLLKRLES